MRPEDIIIHLLTLKASGRGYGPWLDVAISMIERLKEVESTMFEAYDCLGDDEDMRAILARVCESKEGS
jgi:hypothetical protein